MAENRNSNIPNRPKSVRKATTHRHATLLDSRSMSFAEWLYNSYIAILAVIGALIVFAIVIIFARYSVEIKEAEYIVDIVGEMLETEPEEREPEPVERLEDIDRRFREIQNIRNVTSNDASDQEASSPSSSIDAETKQAMDRAQQNMAANRSEYESAMREISGIGQGTGAGGTGSGKKGAKGRYDGQSTVSYIFRNPERFHDNPNGEDQLYTPAYTGKSGGVVVLDVWINRNGEVTGARVVKSANKELDKIALEAVYNYRTKFKHNGSAPASHRGTITYTFVAQ